MTVRNYDQRPIPTIRPNLKPQFLATADEKINNSGPSPLQSNARNIQDFRSPVEDQEPASKPSRKKSLKEKVDKIKDSVKGEMDEIKQVISKQDRTVRAEVEKLIQMTKDSEQERKHAIDEIKSLRDAYRKQKEI